MNKKIIKILRLCVIAFVIMGTVILVCVLYKPALPEEVHIKVAQGNRLYYGSLDNPCTMSFYLYMDSESSYGEGTLIKRVKIEDSESLISLDKINLEKTGETSDINGVTYDEYLLSGQWACSSDYSLIDATLIIDYDDLASLSLAIGNIYYTYYELTTNPIRLIYFKGEVTDNTLRGMNFGLSDSCVIKKVTLGCPDLKVEEEGINYNKDDIIYIPISQAGDYITNTIILTLYVRYKNIDYILHFGKIICGEGVISDYGTCQVPYA